MLQLKLAFANFNPKSTIVGLLWTSQDSKGLGLKDLRVKSQRKGLS